MPVLPANLLQIVAPLALILWLVLWPPNSVAGWLARLVGVGAAVWAIARIAQWAVTGWWMPLVLGALFVVAALVSLCRGALKGRPVWPRGFAGRAGLGVSLVLVVAGGWVAAQLMNARQVPEGLEAAGISNLFGSGRYLVAHGGHAPLFNAHMRTLDEGVPRYRDWRGQSYAVDVFGIGPGGRRADGLRPEDPARYAIFGAALRAPCTGEVLAVENDRPDLPVPEMDSDNKLGNHVMLACDGAVIVMAHLRQGSLRVAPGDRIESGAALAEVGNSGQTMEPHLHIHAQRPAAPGSAPISGASLPLLIGGAVRIRGDMIKGGA